MYEEPEFIDRINNPENYPFIRNKDGSISTHLMANSGVEIEGKETPIAFTMIQMMPNGELYKFKNGELVSIQENKPISKTKKWIVIN